MSPLLLALVWLYIATSKSVIENTSNTHYVSIHCFFPHDFLFFRSESSSIKQGMVAKQRMVTKVWFHVISMCHRIAARSFYSRTCTSLKTPMAAILHQHNVRNLHLRLRPHQALSRNEEVVPGPLQKVKQTKGEPMGCDFCVGIEASN